MNRKEAAAAMHQNKYNCCQAVVCAFEDVLDVDKETLFRIAEGFGAGMGGMQGTCGALIGAEMALGLREYKGRPIGARARSVYSDFAQRCGAVNCIDIKGVLTGRMLCSCDDCVRNAVDILEGD